MANNVPGDRLEGYKTDINGIIIRGLLLGFLSMSIFFISLSADVLRPNPYGTITDSSCMPGSDVVVNLKGFYVCSISAAYFAALLAICLKATLSFTSLPEITIRAWVFLSDAILLLGYVFFYVTVVYSLELTFGNVSCYSTSLILAVILGVLFALGIIIRLICLFSAPSP